MSVFQRCLLGGVALYGHFSYILEYIYRYIYMFIPGAYEPPEGLLISSCLYVYTYMCICYICNNNMYVQSKGERKRWVQSRCTRKKNNCSFMSFDPMLQSKQQVPMFVYNYTTHRCEGEHTHPHTHIHPPTHTRACTHPNTHIRKDTHCIGNCQWVTLGPLLLYTHCEKIAKLGV